MPEILIYHFRSLASLAEPFAQMIYIAIDPSTVAYPPLRAENEIVNPSIKSIRRGERTARCLKKNSRITQENVQEMSDGTRGVA